MTGPRAEFERRIASGQLEKDSAQEPAVDELERLFRELQERETRSRTLAGRLHRLFQGKTSLVRGVYLCGEVGRGKTLLMDLFFHCLPFKEKRRQHFHRFMANTHQRLKALRDRENPLVEVASDIADHCRIICFDEFFVSDIADAMILGNLFTALFERGVTLAATSNVEPRNLYPDGLQRQRFLPAIDMIERNTVVVRVDGKRDYRLGFLENRHLFLAPANVQTQTRLTEAFEAIAPDEGEASGAMEIHGRPVEFVRLSDGVVWFVFSEICDGPRSQDDYIELAREFQTVIISDVPQFTPELENQARRFIAVVDEFYDRRVKLIVSAAVPIEELYDARKLTREFERTRSRLNEMQSRDYLALPHRP